MRTGRLTAGGHRSTRVPQVAIMACSAHANEQPKPFVWTKTADEILSSVADCVSRLQT